MPFHVFHIITIVCKKQKQKQKQKQLTVAKPEGNTPKC